MKVENEHIKLIESVKQAKQDLIKNYANKLQQRKSLL